MYCAVKEVVDTFVCCTIEDDLISIEFDCFDSFTCLQLAIAHVYFRAENAEIHRIREILIRDHEAVCRENERLQNKLRDLEM